LEFLNVEKNTFSIVFPFLMGMVIIHCGIPCLAISEVQEINFER